MSGARLELATIRSADLSRSDLTSAVLGRADLREARMDGAVLKMANLVGARLCRASMREVDLYYARLGRTDLRNADLSGANALLLLTHSRCDKLVHTRWAVGDVVDVFETGSEVVCIQDRVLRDILESIGAWGDD